MGQGQYEVSERIEEAGARLEAALIDDDRRPHTNAEPDMKVRSLTLEYVKSFREGQTISFEDDYTVLVGPNGGGKTNLIDILTIVLRQYFLRYYRVNRQDHVNR